MPFDPWKPASVAPGVRSPHAATVMKRKPPHPATVVQRKPPHPATVVQTKVTSGAPGASSPHAATVMKRKPSHPATVVQTRPAPAGPGASRQQQQRSGDARRSPRVAQASKELGGEQSADIGGFVDKWLASEKGLPKLDELPKTLTIDAELQALFENEYHRSIKEGLEHGAILGFPFDLESEAKLHPGKVVTGKSDGVTTVDGQAPEDTSACGSFHTHPHGKEEKEFEGGDSAHSNADILQLAKNGSHIISFVVSGFSGLEGSPSLYLIVKTVEFAERSEDLKKNSELFSEAFSTTIELLYQEQMKTMVEPRFAMAVAYNQAVILAAKEYKFGFYNGHVREVLERRS